MPNDRWAVVAAGLCCAWLPCERAEASTTVQRPGVPYIIEVWDTKDGLPHSSVIAMTQTRDGYLWLGTPKGLVRFDGASFNVFDESNTPGLTTSLIEKLTTDAEGNIWIGTKYAWFAVVKDGRVVSPQELGPPTVERFPSAAENRLQELKANQLLREQATNLGVGSIPEINATCEDREGNLWAGTGGGGLFLFDAAGKGTVLSTNEGLSRSWILSLLVDRDGTLWVGTDGGGLNRVKRPVFEVLEATAGAVVQSVSADPEGGLWIGYNDGGADYWREGVAQRLGPKSAFHNASVRAVFADRDGGVWLGTWSYAGLFEFQAQRRQFVQVAAARGIQIVHAIHQDRSGRLWLGTQQGLVGREGQQWRVFTSRDGLAAEDVRAIADDAEGNLWVGTAGGGLHRLHLSSGQIASFHKSDGLPSENVSALYVDADGTLWIGTDGGGLARLRGAKFARYTTREGLVSNAIAYLIEDDQGHLWIGSNAGLMRVARKALNEFAGGLRTFLPVRAYREADGLPTRECTFGSQPAACRTPDGRLWFATIKGLVSVNPAQLKPNTNPPPVVIESVLIDEREQNPNALRAVWPQALTVPAGKERLEFRYTSFNLAAADQARFRYRLEGHETAWNEVRDTRVARYSNLPPGEYRFHVMACNEDGVWNEAGSSVAVVVEPPFWRTWWFLTVATASVLGLIVAGVHYFSTQRLQRQLAALKQQEAVEKERARIARDIHDQLGASLTQVSLLGDLVESDKNSPEDVEAHARQISQTARETTRTLDEIVWTVNPSNDTLEGLVNYVCKYAQEYLSVAGLRYRLEVPSQLPATPIPPEVRHNVFLASKEAVTNIVRHAHASSAWLRLHLAPDRFTLEIADDGRGLAGLDEKKAAARNGLRNMRKRMEDIGGQFAMSAAPEGGLEIRLTAPLRDNH